MAPKPQLQGLTHRQHRAITSILVIALVLSCTWFAPELTPTAVPPTFTPTLTVVVPPTPFMNITGSAETIRVGETVTVQMQVGNVNDPTCSRLYYRDGSMKVFGWLGEQEEEVLALAEPVKENGNLTFVLTGKLPGSAELKAACQGNVFFSNEKTVFPDQWFGVSEVIIVTVRP